MYIVKKLNFVHEMYIFKIILPNKYLKFHKKYIKGNNLDFLEERVEKINNEI
jgi:hypothetical protein